MHLGLSESAKGSEHDLLENAQHFAGKVGLFESSSNRATEIRHLAVET
jgi:hypothetical protein